jgi:PAS domain S-box-containing protein
MNTNSTGKVKAIEHLTVIHKASPPPPIELLHPHDAVIQTDLNLNVTGWNPMAETLHGQPGAMGKNLFQLADIEFIGSSFQQFKSDLQANRSWSGEVIFNRYDGQKVHLRSVVNYIINEHEEPTAIMFVNQNITDLKIKEKQLAQAERQYETLVNTLFDGVVMINTEGRITTCNKRASEILGITSDQFVNRKILGLSSMRIIKEDGTEFKAAELPGLVSLETGEPMRNIIMGVKKTDGRIVWLSVNSQAIFNAEEKKPYASVVSFSDITDKLKSEEALRKTTERLYYSGRVASDAIWDLDLETNEIYRSDAFVGFSGYKDKDIQPNLDWWFEKTHPDDRKRVREGILACIEKRIENWQDEYRFKCADGNYRNLLDSAIILYKEGKAVRIIGAIQDLTERKKLEAKLIHDEIQKQKQLSQAAISAQEKERNNISKELHDNVNQILTSAKLFMGSAQRDIEQRDELLAKAIEYQMLALEEIRKLSRSLSTSLVKAVGLRESLEDIVYNMRSLQNMNVEFKFNERVSEKLSDDQKLMIFRIIQEQTSNVIKYSEAKSVQILLNEIGERVHLVISDDGKGFDTKKKAKGIGLINIMSRADAYNGKVSIISSPGNGCTLELQFPVKAQ